VDKNEKDEKDERDEREGGSHGKGETSSGKRKRLMREPL
jgi:hypothetical protein